MSAQDVMKMIEDNEVKFVDFRFTDTHGKEHHVSVPSHTVDEDKFEEKLEQFRCKEIYLAFNNCMSFLYFNNLGSS